MKEELVNLRNDFFALVMDVRDLSELENIRIAYLGRNGKISGSIKKIKEISAKERGEFGRLVNETKSTIEEEIRIKYAQLVEDKKTRFDPTVPGLKQQAGHRPLKGGQYGLSLQKQDSGWLGCPASTVEAALLSQL